MNKSVNYAGDLSQRSNPSKNTSTIDTKYTDKSLDAKYTDKSLDSKYTDKSLDSKYTDKSFDYYRELSKQLGKRFNKSPAADSKS